MRNTFRSATLLACLVVGLFAAAGPALADTELGHTGTVGAHSFLDTVAYPGGSCSYKYLATYDVNKLKLIVARAPKVKAVAGKASQLVGYRVIVQRKYGSTNTNNPWVDKFTSAEVTATTSDTANAYFGPNPHITVAVPYGPTAQGVDAQYRVVMRLIWHNSNGSTQGTATHRMDHYGLYVQGGMSPPMTPKNAHCAAYWNS